MSDSRFSNLLKPLGIWVQSSPQTARAVVVALAAVLSIALIQVFGSGLQLSLVPLDVTQETPMDEAFIAQLRDSAGNSLETVIFVPAGAVP